jgi:hypothetical protein
MSEAGPGGPEIRRNRIRLAGIAASAVLIVAAVVLAITGGSGGSGVETVATAAHIVDASELSDLESELGHPIYWAGERPPAQLELAVEADGSAYLRYLSPGVEAGDPEQRFLTVGTYPVVDAVGALERTARSSGSTLGRAAGGGVVLANPSSEGSVYLAYPGSDIQIEVYDPTPGRSLRLIRSGAIVPVGEG